MIAVSESTPGPIMVNLATYIGSTQAGLPGGILATLAVVLPSFLIILLITAILGTVIRHPYVQAMLRGLKPCIIGIILATGLYMTAEHCFVGQALDVRAAGMTVGLVGIMAGEKKCFGRKLSPIALIVISAVAGMAVYGV